MVGGVLSFLCFFGGLGSCAGGSVFAFVRVPARKEFAPKMRNEVEICSYMFYNIVYDDDIRMHSNANSAVVKPILGAVSIFMFFETKLKLPCRDVLGHVF